MADPGPHYMYCHTHSYHEQTAGSRNSVTIKDDAGDRRVRVTVRESEDSVAIYAAGYGNCAARDAPVACLCVQDGELRLVYFPDHGSEENVTVSLERARIPREPTPPDPDRFRKMDPNWGR